MPPANKPGRTFGGHAVSSLHAAKWLATRAFNKSGLATPYCAAANKAEAFGFSPEPTALVARSELAVYPTASTCSFPSSTTWLCRNRTTRRPADQSATQPLPSRMRHPRSFSKSTANALASSPATAKPPGIASIWEHELNPESGSSPLRQMATTSCYARYRQANTRSTSVGYYPASRKR